MRLAAARLRPDQAPEPLAAHQRRPSAGAATRPSTGMSSSTSEIRVAQAGTPRTKLCVPSMGSMTQRRGPCPVVSNSSPSTASRGRVRLSCDADELLGRLVGVADEGEVGLGLHDEVVRPEPRHRDPLDGVRQDMGKAQVVVIGHLPTLARRRAAAGDPATGGSRASTAGGAASGMKHHQIGTKATPAEDLLSTRQPGRSRFCLGLAQSVAFTPCLPFHGCHNTNALCVTGLRSTRCTARTDRSVRTADPK